MAVKPVWPVPLPAWWWPWARWRLGRSEFKGHANDPKYRPKDAPAKIPWWAWARLAVFLGNPLPPKPKPPKPQADPALMKARAMLDWARGFKGSYVFGGGHGRRLDTLNRLEGLDCSSSTSLLLWHFDLYDGNYAQVSGWYETWAVSGRGKYVTVHANDDHVWVEFRLPSSAGPGYAGYHRFDTSPHGDGPRGPRVRTKQRFDSTFAHRHPAGL